MTVEELFWEAHQLSGSEEREAFMADLESRSPGDAARVRDLLAIESKAHDVFGKLESAPRLEATCDSNPGPDESTEAFSVHARSMQLQIGETIGAYKLLEPIGEGGMGVVYLAHQSEPVRRKVALKIIKPGMDSRQVIARFEAERQALAMMEHPNIARALDAGTTESGLPYFVMELVRGIPMSDYCDRAKMPNAERLKLFCDACGAIQHAHNKGIIHRDIKPSNVLVTEQDGKPVVKVIDFGVAKALTDNLTDKTLFTGMFQIMGTPLYMSPEQASLSNVDVDIRSDVYSLGVMLYELLSGSLPIDRDELKELSFEQLRKRICDTEPPRPSKRLSTLKDERETVAERRGIDVSRVHQLVTSELDWIVMRSLEKDRSRRYQSAREFAEDVQRYLDGDAVEAMPPSLWYGFRKQYRKHRIAVLFTLGLCVSMVAAVVGTSLQAVRAMKAEKLAEFRLQAIQRGQQEIRLALLSAEEQRDKAGENYERARAAVEQLLARVATQEIAAISEMDTVRRKLLADAAGFYTKLIEMNPQDSRNYAERASVNIKLQRFQFVRPDLEKAIELDPRNEHYHHALAFFFQNCPDEVYQGERNVVLQHAMAAVEIGPATHGHHANLAQIFKWRFQDNAKAELHLRQAAKLAGHENPIAKLKYLIKADRFAGKHKEIIKRASEVDADSDDAQFTYHLIAESHMAMGQFEEAVVMETKALESARLRLADQANHYSHYLLSGRGNAHMKLGQNEKALQDYEAAIAVSPYRSSYYKRKALLLYLLGRKDYVIDVLRQSFELNPDDLSCFYWLNPDHFLRNPDPEFANEYLAFMTKGVSQARSNDSVDSLAAMLYWRSRLFLTLGDITSAHADRFELEPLIGELKESEVFADRLVELDQLIYKQMKNPDYPTQTETSLGKGDAPKGVETIASSEMESEAEWAARKQLFEAKRVFGKQSSETAKAMLSLAVIERQQGNDQAFEKLILESLDVADAIDKSNWLERVRSEVVHKNDIEGHLKLGLSLCEQERWRKANQVFSLAFGFENSWHRDYQFQVPWAFAKAKLGEVEDAIAMYDHASLTLVAKTSEPAIWLPRYRAAFRKQAGRSLQEERASQLALAKSKSLEKHGNYYYRTAWQKLLWLIYLQDPQSVAQQQLEDTIESYQGLELKDRLAWCLALLPLYSIGSQEDRVETEFAVLVNQASEQLDELGPYDASHIVRLASMSPQTATHQSLLAFAEKSSRAGKPIPAHLYPMGLWELHNGTPEKALEWLERAQELADESEKFEPALAAMLSIVHHRLGHFGQADQWLEKTEISLDQVDRLHPHTIAEWFFYRRDALRLSKQRQSEALLRPVPGRCRTFYPDRGSATHGYLLRSLRDRDRAPIDREAVADGSRGSAQRHPRTSGSNHGSTLKGSQRDGVTAIWLPSEWAG